MPPQTTWIMPLDSCLLQFFKASTFWLNRLSMEDSNLSDFMNKYLHLWFEDEQKSQKMNMDLERHEGFGVNYHFKVCFHWN